MVGASLLAKAVFQSPKNRAFTGPFAGKPAPTGGRDSSCGIALLAFFAVPDRRHGSLGQMGLYPTDGLAGEIAMRQPSRLEEVFVMTVKPIPEGQPRITAYLGLQDVNLCDPYGVIWFVATHKEDLTPDEIRERAAKVFN